MGSTETSSAAVLEIEGKQLWEGCILALCIHGVMLPEYPFILNDHIWIDGLYQTMDHAGTKAVLAFSGEHIPMIGMFRQYYSERTGLVMSEQYARFHFKGAPDKAQEMADAMFCLFDEPVGEQVLPVVTTGFWAEEGKLFSRDSFEDWINHGGSILENQMKAFDEAMAYYEKACSMDSERAKIAERIYRERIQSPGKEILLTGREVEIIGMHGDIHNMDVCREAFEALQVFFET